MYAKIINIIGENGPHILFVLSIILFINKTNLLIYNIVGCIVNFCLNLILKGIFKHPRPNEDMKKFNIMVKHGERFIYKDGIPYDLFGMPSAHTQAVFYFTMYCFMALDNYTYLLFVIISLVTLYQRVIDNHHTVLQVIVGAVIGTVIGYLFYHLSKTYYKKELAHKKDDNCKIL